MLHSRLKPHGSIYRDLIKPRVVQLLLSNSFIQLRRHLLRISSFVRQEPITLNVFVAADDADSFVLLQCLLKLKSVYNTNISVKVLDIAVNGWSTSIDTKYNWVNRNAGLFAVKYSLLQPRCNISQCTKTELKAVTRKMFGESSSSSPLEGTYRHLKALWSPDEDMTLSCNDIDENMWSDEIAISLSNNLALMKKLGYYNPGAVEFQGEWYPPSRLHHLERRLRCDFSNCIHNSDDTDLLFDQEWESTNADIRRAGFNYTEKCNYDMISDPVLLPTNLPAVEMFYSFRSPYSQLVLKRLLRVCQKYGTEVIVNPVLPMVTRGLKVSREKEMYIAQDAAREAKLWEISFGRLVDPLHPDKAPFLRAMDAFSIAQKYDRADEFIEVYGVYQWGYGLSAGTDYGLRKMIYDSGLPLTAWNEARDLISSETIEQKFIRWQHITSPHKEFLVSRGLWGVPCLKYKDVVVFGQDKLWVIEKVLETESCGKCVESDRIYQAILEHHA